MQRSAPRLARLLASAAVPVMLIAGCSSGPDSGSSKKASDGKPTDAGSASASPALPAAKYAKLPAACGSVTAKTVKQLVPKAKHAGGQAAQSSDATARGGCSWNGLDGYQYRWLDVGLQRFSPVVGIGSGDQQAVKQYADQIATAKAVKGATSGIVAGIGDATTVVTAEVSKDKEQYQEVTIITRTGNVVVVLSYNGAGFESARTPKAADLSKSAQTAARDVEASVAAANA
jgi:hypothetical protein